MSVSKQSKSNMLKGMLGGLDNKRNNPTPIDPQQSSTPQTEINKELNEQINIQLNNEIIIDPPPIPPTPIIPPSIPLGARKVKKRGSNEEKEVVVRTFEIAVDLERRFKTFCAAHGKSKREVLEMMIENYLKQYGMGGNSNESQ